MEALTFELASLIFSALVAVSTMVYAVLTWKLVSETKKMREAQTEPKISVSIQPREEWIALVDMVIQNIGLGPAYDIKFKINPDFEYSKNMFLSEIGFIKNGIRYLAPNQRIRFFLTSLAENSERKIQRPFEIKVTYRNAIGKIYEDAYLIDFSELIGLRQLGEPPLYKIAKSIEKIEREICHLSTGFHKMGVVVYTRQDEEEINKEIKADN